MSDRLALLEKYRSKARCFWSHRTADTLWWQLKPLLTSKQRGDLLSAVGHIDIGEGPSELDMVCAEIKKDWSQ